jgi:hypothetical protein
MTDQDARQWATLAILGLGLLLYVLMNAWTPTQVQIGPLQIGSSQGDCHGISQIHVGLCR